jgi:flagellar biosynthesis/type III secretory pathway chaperone
VNTSFVVQRSEQMADVLNELSRVLWQQRQDLDRLLFRVEVQQMLLIAGRDRWVAAAAADVEAVMDSIRHREIHRAVVVTAAARELGIDRPDPSLRELAEVVPDPWGSILNDHRQAFLTLTGEIEQCTRHNRELLHRGFELTRELIASLTGDDTGALGYQADGSAARLAPAAHLLDRAV